MEYRHAPPRDERDLASGAVLRSAPGLPAFPVRLAVELFGRALDHLEADASVTLWDPCCGAAQLLAALGLRQRQRLRSVVGSDADAQVVELARRNLELLTDAGLATRADELRDLAARHGRDGPLERALAAERLATGLRADGGDLPGEIHHLDVFDADGAADLVARHHPEVVIADLPHGQLTTWTEHAADSGSDAEVQRRLAQALGAVLSPTSVVVLVGRGRKLALPAGVSARERVRVGHRSAAIVLAGDLAG